MGGGGNNPTRTLLLDDLQILNGHFGCIGHQLLDSLRFL
jgi:hypothetical protein